MQSDSAKLFKTKLDELNKMKKFSYFANRFSQTKITLFIFFKKWVR